MIFPDIPKRYRLQEPRVEPIIDKPKTPLHIAEQEHTMDIELWFEQHGLPSKRTDPAALPRTQGQIDWLAQDAWEFYCLCTVIMVWIGYWWGVHHGVW